MTTRKTTPDKRGQESTPEELVVDALNEQGYLLHHKIVDVLRSNQSRKYNHTWEIEASEVPVSLPNEDETRIDLVLRSSAPGHKFWRLVMECKRLAREYKRWVFFGHVPWPSGLSPSNYYIERADLASSWDHSSEPNLCHRVEPRPASPECPVFDYGVEARTNRPGSGQRSSATNAIEDAFQQVTLGQAGLAIRLRAAHELNFRLVPVVVTTAELMEARFSVDDVSADCGMLDEKKLRIVPHRWLAVNFRMKEIACQYSGVTTNRTTDLAVDLAARQIRTVFVTQSVHVNQFLEWLEKVFEWN